MQDYGLVSVITPSYNCAEFIGATIESIQSQTYTNWELLITDDCSSDRSREVIEEYARGDSRIRLLRLEKNSGAGVARNNSIAAARGRFIAFCDSDDRWYSDKLEKQLAFMVGGNYGLTYSSYDICDESDQLIGRMRCARCLTPSKILRDNGIGCLTAIYDTEITGKKFMPLIRKRQDWCLWIDIIRQIRKAYGFREPLALYRLRSGSISSNKITLLKYNFSVYHEMLGYGRITSALILFGYFMPFHILKRVRIKLSRKSLHINI